MQQVHFGILQIFVVLLYWFFFIRFTSLKILVGNVFLNINMKGCEKCLSWTCPVKNVLSSHENWLKFVLLKYTDKLISCYTLFKRQFEKYQLINVIWVKFSQCCWSGHFLPDPVPNLKKMYFYYIFKYTVRLCPFSPDPAKIVNIWPDPTKNGPNLTGSNQKGSKSDWNQPKTWQSNRILNPRLLYFDLCNST